LDTATWGLVVATFLACFVEMVEATTIVMAMGYTRSWRSALTGVAAALVALVVVTVAFGYALATWLPESALQLVIGGLLLVFGLQWLRKAILRSSGRKATHDEDAIFQKEVAAARAAAGGRTGGLDMFSFMVSFKGVFLEGMEVVFIVITFGLNADDVLSAATGAAIAVVSVLLLAALLRRPLSMINENLLKYAVGLLLAGFGTFWVVEGVGIFRPGRESLDWPGHDLALLAIIAVWFLVSRIFVAALRTPGGKGLEDTAGHGGAPVDTTHQPTTRET
jgi:Ca2+/H+ antiporter, TMEM165/GDT1 family